MPAENSNPTNTKTTFSARSRFMVPSCRKPKWGKVHVHADHRRESYVDGVDGSTKPEAPRVQGFCLSETVSGFGEDALVVVFVGRDDVVGAVVFLGVDASDFAHFTAAVGAGQDFDGVARCCLHVAGFHQKSIHAVRDHLGDASDVGGDDGNFASHGFEGGESEGFELRGKKEEIGGG